MKNLRLKVGFIVFAAWLATPVYGGSEVTPAGGSFGDDPEFGVVEEITFRKSNWEPWSVTIGADLHYFENIRSLDLRPLNLPLGSILNEDDDFIFRTGLKAEYTPLITGSLFFDSSITQDFYRFDKLEYIDFDYFSGDAGLIYILRDFWDLQLFGRYRYERISSASFGSQLYSNNSVEVGAQQVYRFAPGQSVFGSLKGQFSLDANPDTTGYNEYSLNLGYCWERDPFELIFLYRCAYLDFDELDRNDCNNVVMLRGEYHWTDNLILAADVSFTSNNSDIDAFEFDSFGAGLDISFNYQF